MASTPFGTKSYIYASVRYDNVLSQSYIAEKLVFVSDCTRETIFDEIFYPIYILHEFLAKVIDLPNSWLYLFELFLLKFGESQPRAI